MVADSPIPLASAADMNSGQFADLVRDFAPDVLDQLMVEATRVCEGIAGRRLAPFTAIPESHRATGVDPDDSSEGGMPVSIQSTLAMSYASRLGYGTDLVRHCWLHEFAPRYPEMWTYSDLSVDVFQSIGGSQTYPAAQLIGAEADSGHVWFSLGSFIPAGSLIRVVYSGGYTTIPADLNRAGKLQAAVLALGEIDPVGNQFALDPGALSAQAEAILCKYQPT